MHAYSIFDEEALNDDQNSIYDSEEDDILQFAQSNQPLNYQEMPPSVLQSNKKNLKYKIYCQENFDYLICGKKKYSTYALIF